MPQLEAFCQGTPLPRKWIHIYFSRMTNTFHFRSDIRLTNSLLYEPQERKLERNWAEKMPKGKEVQSSSCLPRLQEEQKMPTGLGLAAQMKRTGYFTSTGSLLSSTTCRETSYIHAYIHSNVHIGLLPCKVTRAQKKAGDCSLEGVALLSLRLTRVSN